MGQHLYGHSTIWCMAQCYLLTPLSPCGVCGQRSWCHRMLPGPGCSPARRARLYGHFGRSPALSVSPSSLGTAVTHHRLGKAGSCTGQRFLRRPGQSSGKGWMKAPCSSPQGPRAGSNQEQMLAAATPDGLPRCGAVLPGTRRSSLVACGSTPHQSDAEIPGLSWS